MTGETNGHGESVTQMRWAREGVVTQAMRRVAEREGLDAEDIRRELAAGRLIIPANVNHTSLDPMGIGTVCSVKVNANIGNSALASYIDEEVQKLRTSVKYGADTVMDLSTGGEIDATRVAIIQASAVPVGIVPMYLAVAEVKKLEVLTAELLLATIE